MATASQVSQAAPLAIPNFPSLVRCNAKRPRPIDDFEEIAQPTRRIRLMSNSWPHNVNRAGMDTLERPTYT